MGLAILLLSASLRRTFHRSVLYSAFAKFLFDVDIFSIPADGEKKAIISAKSSLAKKRLRERTGKSKWPQLTIISFYYIQNS
jgi:hypothetical protein